MSAPRPDAAATPQPKSRGGASWGSRSFGRDNVKLKLLASLRGEGVLVSADRAIPASYELDLYARGAVRTASGHLEGDFSAIAEVEDETSAWRLRMSDGVEIEIDLTDLDGEAAEFESRGPLDLAAG